MIRSRWGRIISVSSLAAVIGNRGQTNYAAAKAGLPVQPRVRMTKQKKIENKAGKRSMVVELILEMKACRMLWLIV
jgi:NAD(P)-dependent dehydrogenase (short-subunit alcohol dehydrogenase family)